MITGFGGLAGLVFGAAQLGIFARTMGFYFDLLGISFSWSSAVVLQLAAVMAVVVSALLGIIGAFVPSWRIRRMVPHALIHSGMPAT